MQKVNWILLNLWTWISSYRFPRGFANILPSGKLLWNTLFPATVRSLFSLTCPAECALRLEQRHVTNKEILKYHEYSRDWYRNRTMITRLEPITICNPLSGTMLGPFWYHFRGDSRYTCVPTSVHLHFYDVNMHHLATFTFTFRFLKVPSLLLSEFWRCLQNSEGTFTFTSRFLKVKVKYPTRVFLNRIWDIEGHRKGYVGSAVGYMWDGTLRDTGRIIWLERSGISEMRCWAQTYWNPSHPS